MTLALLVAGFVACLLIRVPVAIALLVPSLIYILILPNLSLGIAIQRVTSGIDVFVLLAVPLFILAGNVMNSAGITDRVFRFVEVLLGRVRGSLGYVNIGVSVLFSGMSGSATADSAALGTVEVSAMRKQGYDDHFSLGVTAASSTIGPIIPPSIPAVIYGVAAGVSVGGLFIAGVVPGLLMALTLSMLVYISAKRHNYPQSEQASLRDIIVATVKATPALLTPAIILGGIISGIFTPTEAAVAAAAYALFIGLLIYRSLTLKDTYKTLVSTAETTGAILLIIGSASLFAWILALEQAPQALASAILSVTESTWVFLFLVNVILLIVGAIMETSAAILILVPILLPSVEAFGIDPLHFGIIVLVNLMIGLLTPPMGLVLFVLSSATETPVTTVIRGVAPFLIPLLVALVLITYFPTISLFLPRLLGMA